MQVFQRFATISLLLSLAGCVYAQPAAYAEDASGQADQAADAKPKKTKKYKPAYDTATPEPASVYAPEPNIDEPAPVQPGTIEYAQLQLKQKDFKGAEKTYKDLNAQHLYNGDILLGIAFCEHELGNLDEAIRYAVQAVEAEPKSPEAHVALGHYREENRELQDAYLQYERASELKPSDELRNQIFVPTLRILLAMNQMQVAVSKAHGWAHQFPKNSLCQYNNGWVLSQCGDERKLPEAVNSYESALRLDPSLVGAHFNVAILLYKLGRNQDAIDEVDQFIKLAPNDPDIKQAKALLKKLKIQVGIIDPPEPEKPAPKKQTAAKPAAPHQRLPPLERPRISSQHLPRLQPHPLLHLNDAKPATSSASTSKSTSSGLSSSSKVVP